MRVEALVSDPHRMCGWWSGAHRTAYIKENELWAVILTLQALTSNGHRVSVLLRIDNTLALVVIHKFGGVRFPKLHARTREIWSFCEPRHIWLLASGIPSEENVVADLESLRQRNHTEGKLKHRFFL